MKILTKIKDKIDLFIFNITANASNVKEANKEKRKKAVQDLKDIWAEYKESLELKKNK